jgi:hypothetical protein
MPIHLGGQQGHSNNGLNGSSYSPPSKAENACHRGQPLAS